MLESLVHRRAMLSGSALGAVASRETRGDSAYDVIVVGSGAAGSAAALFAAAAGARVAILEKSGVRGGTTAKSNGRYWIPNNPALGLRGLSDPREDFLRYVARYSFPGRFRADAEHFGVDLFDLELMRAFYDNGSEMVSELETLGVARSIIAPEASSCDRGAHDFFSHAAENKCSWGRSLVVDAGGRDGGGAALIGRFARGLDARGVPLFGGHAVRDVIREDGRVAGVVAEVEGRTKRIRARRGVIFATGGYLHDPAKRASLHLGPIYEACAVPEATGDFIPIAAACGAMMGNLNSAWRIQGVVNQAFDYWGSYGDFSLPGDSAIVVDREGRRCLNEAASSHDRARTMYRWNANFGNYPNLINIYVYDDRAAGLFAGLFPFARAEERAPAWRVSGDTIEALAQKLRDQVRALAGRTGGADLAPDFAARLAETIKRFNTMAAAGRDEDFRRGETEAERYRQVCVLRAQVRGMKGHTKTSNAHPNNCLHPIAAQGPYHAVLLVPSAIDSNGGPVIDTSGRVVDNLRRPIPGLYAAGNCVASPARDAPWGPGAATGLALTFGMLAGRTAAGQGQDANDARTDAEAV